RRQAEPCPHPAVDLGQGHDWCLRAIATLRIENAVKGMTMRKTLVVAAAALALVARTFTAFAANENNGNNGQQGQAQGETNNNNGNLNKENCPNNGTDCQK